MGKHTAGGTFISLSVLALAAGAAAKGVWTTPHDSYSSSVGVLGCKVNTNRVAYWPGSVDCNNICVKLSYGERSVHLLRVDQSGGAYDISYDAWNYLQTGESATANPIAGGAVAMEYEDVDASECADLIHTAGSKLPLSAANSINFVSSCLAQPSSWVARNYVLYNICDAICSLGFDEVCSLDLATSNQPSCPHTLGLTSKLTTAPVYNIEYISGKTVVAGTGQVVPPNAEVPNDGGSTASRAASSSPSAQPTPTPAIFLEHTSTTALTGTPTTSSTVTTTNIAEASSSTSQDPGSQTGQYIVTPSAAKPVSEAPTTQLSN
jgi:hypothetical protein